MWEVYMPNSKAIIELCKVTDAKNNKEVKKLLRRHFKDNSADLNSPVQSPEFCQGAPVTPLSIAALSGNDDALSAFLELGANPNLPTVYPALLDAVKCNHLSTVRILLTNNKIKANVNIIDNIKCTALHIAAQKGLYEMAVLLLDNDALIDAQAEAGVTPLLAAVERRQMQMIELLCSRGANRALPCTGPDSKQLTVMNCAAGNNLDEIVLFFLRLIKQVTESELDDIKKSYYIAYKYNYNKIMSILEIHLRSLTDQPHLKLNSFFHTIKFVKATMRGDVKLLEKLLADAPGFTIDTHCEIYTKEFVKINASLLCQAILFEQLEVTQFLIAQNADPVLFFPDKATTPLHTAAVIRNVDILGVLLSSNKIRGNQRSYVNCLDGNKMTPLANAALTGNTQAMKLLKAASGDPNWQVPDYNNKTQPLLNILLRLEHVSIQLQTEQVASIMLLLQQGADPNKCSSDGEHPLFIAIRSKNIKKVRAICSSKSVNLNEYLNIVINENTPLFCALMEGTPEIVTFLLGLGADPNLLVRRKRNLTSNVFTLYTENQDIGFIKTDEIKSDVWGIRSIHVAMVKSVNIEMIDTLKKFGTDFNFRVGDSLNPLMIAIQLNQLDKFTRLLQLGAEPALFSTDKFGTLQTFAEPYFSLILNHPAFSKEKATLHNGFNILSPLCITNQAHYIPRLLKLRFDPLAGSDANSTPFAISIRCGAVESLMILIKHIDKQGKLDELLNKELKRDCYPLQIVYLFNKKMARVLIKKGANPNISCPDDPSKTIAQALNIVEPALDKSVAKDILDYSNTGFQSVITMTGRKFLMEKGYTAEEISEMQKGYQNHTANVLSEFWDNPEDTNSSFVTWCDGRVTLELCPPIREISNTANCYYLLMEQDVSTQGCPPEVLHEFKNILPIFTAQNIKKIDLNDFELQVMCFNQQLSLKVTHEICTGTTKHRVLVGALKSDDGKQTLYLAAKFLKAGLHDTKDIKSLMASSRRLELHFPIQESVVESLTPPSIPLPLKSSEL